MSVQAAVNAGIPCVAVPGFWCKEGHDYSAAIARLEDLPEAASVSEIAALLVPKKAAATKNPTSTGGASHYGKEKMMNSHPAFEVDEKMMGA